MRRKTAALLVGAAAVLTSAQTASTASNAVPTSVAVHRTTTVTGATMTGLDHVVTGGVVTGVQPRLRGTRLLTSTVRARFGGDTGVVCTAGLLTVLDALTGLREGTYTCLGLTEDADRPRPLTISVS